MSFFRVVVSFMDLGVCVIGNRVASGGKRNKRFLVSIFRVYASSGKRCVMRL